MRAIQVSRHGGPEVLDIADVPVPVAGVTDVVVRTEAIGVNFIDTYFRSGLYRRETPFVSGQEGCGVIVEVGSAVDDLAVGDRVAWASAPGSYAEFVAVPAAIAVPVPDGVSAPVAASALLQGITAQYLLESVYKPEPGETILVHAGAGGVGLALTQLATAAGVRVLSTVSTGAKAQISRDAGAAEALPYTDDLAERVRELTDGIGVAAVYDGVGKTTFESSLASLRVRGTLALFGAASGPVPPFDPQRLNAMGSLVLTRPSLVHFTRDRAELLWRAGAVFDAIADGILTVRIGATYPLDRAADAHTDLEARKTTGSIVLLP